MGSELAHDLPPAPGSREAIEAGCTCPVLDNSHGLGYLGDGKKYGWWMSADCPLHGLKGSSRTYDGIRKPTCKE